MADAVAIVCPSRADNLPNVAIEAMSLGVPIVGVRGASIDELVIDGESGCLAPPDDAAGLAAAIRTVWSLPCTDRNAMGVRARQRVLTMLDDNECHDALIRLYGRAVRVGARRRRSRQETGLQVRADLAGVERLCRNEFRPRPWKWVVRSLTSGLKAAR
jgi:hypothetical protein